jgi:hypothetical protein
MILDKGKHGMVRMFECERTQHEHITPHSHRFDFSACVLQGSVENTIWAPTTLDGDDYAVSALVYSGVPGEYTRSHVGSKKFTTRAVTHETGTWYSMKAEEIHSIKFSKGAQVIFFECGSSSNVTHALEPFVDGETIPTMRTASWMFKKGN